MAELLLDLAQLDPLVELGSVSLRVGPGQVHTPTVPNARKLTYTVVIEEDPRATGTPMLHLFRAASGVGELEPMR